MPRAARQAPGGMIFQVLNRGNARDQIFDDDAGDAAFEKVLADTQAEDCPSPIPTNNNWITRVNHDLTKKELEAVQTSVTRGRPFGSISWQEAKQLGLESSFRNRCCPKKIIDHLNSLIIGLIPFSSPSV
jgi:hypothetical protein